MALSQDTRVMKIRTPLGKDVLLLAAFEATEEMSRPFSVVAELLHEGTPGGEEVKEIDPSSILAKSVCIEIEQRDKTKRYFNGIVSRFEQRNRDDRFTHFQMEIVPKVWLLSQRSQSRIFQHMTIPDILRKVFEGITIAWNLRGRYEKRNYCVQYRETDLDFAMRLMEEEGIFYFFKHTDQEHEMVIGDEVGAYGTCPVKSTVSFDLNIPRDDDFVSLVRTWIVNYRLQTGKVTYWDHNFELPYKKLEDSKETVFPLEIKNKLEVYDYPGRYAQIYDGIDKSGGEQASELEKIFTERAHATNKAMQAIDSRYKIISGAGDCASFTSGHKFTLENHPIASSNREYVLTSVSHSATQSPDYASEDSVLDPYDNSFTCIPAAAGSIFRPGQITPKPVIPGAQTATVVGPAGEEIFTDKYGRVKVQFHWDRDGKLDPDSSCWIRVAQTWSGKKWGTMFIPRIGMEVVVSFIEGDPDRPIITGCVPNPDMMPPYTLPDEKTKSTIKTNSSTGGGGFNELRFEDKKGEEEIFIHAEKNMDIRIKHDKKELVINDRHTIVEKNSFEEGRGDSSYKLSGDSRTEMGGSSSTKVGGDIDTKVGGKYALDAGGEIHLKAGMKVVIEAGTQITLKVGGNFVDIGPAGVTIVGTLVNINSGGAAGSGSGCSTTAPTAPKEAGKAEAGSQAAKPPPPPGAGSTTGTAAAMGGAAGSGAPTVDAGTGSGSGGSGGSTGAGTGGSGAGSGSGGGAGGSGGAEPGQAEAGYPGGYGGGMTGEDAKIGGGTGGDTGGNTGGGAADPGQAEAGYPGGYGGGMTGEGAKIGGGTGGDTGGHSGAGAGEPIPPSGTGSSAGQSGDQTDQEGNLGGQWGESDAGQRSGEAGSNNPPDDEEPVPATGGF
jgi:type VI secretion system secreted protein VgrG